MNDCCLAMFRDCLCQMNDETRAYNFLFTGIGEVIDRIDDDELRDWSIGRIYEQLEALRQFDDPRFEEINFKLTDEQIEFDEWARHVVGVLREDGELRTP